MAINRYGGGARTNRNGLLFEQETSLEEALIDVGYIITDRNVVKDRNGNCLGIIAPKYAFYKRILEPENINWQDYISKRLLPDEAFLNFTNNTVYIIEKKFQIQLCLGTFSTATGNYGIALQRGFGIDNIGKRLSALTEFKGIRLTNVCHRFVHQNAATADDEDMVEQGLNVVNLMRADDERALLGHMLCHDATKLCLRGDVQPVGGFVHEQQTSAGSKGKAHENLLLLPH